MQINKVHGTNFTGMYRIPLNQKNVDYVTKVIVPAFGRARNRGIDYFFGDNPYRIISDSIIKDIADKSGASLSWLRSNAETFNLDVSNFGNKYMYIITGDKDILALNSYINSNTSKNKNFVKNYAKNWKPTFKDKLKQLFLPQIAENEIDTALPEHLQTLKKVMDFAKKNTEDFEQFAKERIVELDSPEELVLRLLIDYE